MDFVSDRRESHYSTSNRESADSYYGESLELPEMNPGLEKRESLYATPNGESGIESTYDYAYDLG